MSSSTKFSADMLRKFTPKYTFNIFNREDIDELNRLTLYISGLIIKDEQTADEAETARNMKSADRFIRATEGTLRGARGFEVNAIIKNYSEENDYYIDLVFYNYILKCFVLIDLKIGKLTHQDVGQMDMYVRMYDEMKRTEGDNPTIGIILCEEKDRAEVRYSVLNDNQKLFATKYKLYIPTEEELIQEITQIRSQMNLEE